MTRALLLTDVVDSTKLVEALGDAATARIWAAHDRVARDLLGVHGGREIDKTDGFLLLFDDARAAAAYAVAYHRAIAALDPPLAARAGLHVGDVVLTHNAAADVARGAKPVEVDGLAKPTAARVMSIAAGGQTLLTREAADALGATGLRVGSHGHWRLKGVAEPMELFEVRDDDAPLVPPPDAAKAWRVVQHEGIWLPVREVRRHLPAERDAFVGRAADLRALAELVERSRLVSVLGIGGTGKTRLVTRFAWTWLGDFPGGAWFCDLSEARSVDGMCHAVAAALGMPLADGTPVVQLGHAIAGRGACLVVLDNFEQVARHAEETLGRWLDRAPDARFVVTSREVLGLPGESALALAPLVGDEAFGLFVARARQAKLDFAVDDAASIRALVALLDGLPLAIELAAARVRVMPPKMLLERMSQRFKLLASTGGRHTRQATLRGALDWSWDLLSADEQAALAQLSVFEGGFTLEAAEAVLALPDLWTTDAVQALVDKSLVRQASVDPDGGARMDLLVTVQEYAAEKLDARGDRAEAEARHRAWYAQWGAEEWIESLDAHGGPARRSALTRDLDNLVTACRRSVAAGAVDPAVALLRAVVALLQLAAPPAVAADLAERVNAMPGLTPRAQASARAFWGRALAVLGRTDDADAHFRAALALAMSPAAGPDALLEADVRCSLASLHMHVGRLDVVREHLERAQALTRALGMRRQEGWVTGNLGLLASHLGRRDEALVDLEASLAVARELGDRRAEGGACINLGLVHWRQGRYDQARACFDEGLALARSIADHRTTAAALRNLGILDTQQGRHGEASAHLEAALAVARQLGARRLEGEALGDLGMLRFEVGRLAEARDHYEAALAIHRETGVRRRVAQTLSNLGSLDRLRGDNARAIATFEEALALLRTLGERRGEGIVLAALAGAHHDEGRGDEARALYECALGTLREVGDLEHQGTTLGDLGRLHVEEGRLAEARESIEAGEALLRSLAVPLSLAALWVDRARLERAEGRREVALRTLAEADEVAQRLGAGPQSALGRALAAAHAALDAP